MYFLWNTMMVQCWEVSPTLLRNTAVCCAAMGFHNKMTRGLFILRTHLKFFFLFNLFYKSDTMVGLFLFWHFKVCMSLVQNRNIGRQIFNKKVFFLNNFGWIKKRHVFFYFLQTKLSHSNPPHRNITCSLKIQLKATRTKTQSCMLANNCAHFNKEMSRVGWYFGTSY